MRVKDLIEKLSKMDPNADVYLMNQPNYPFEYSIEGIVERKEFQKTSPDRENDVFILEGSQLRYGSKKAWESSFDTEIFNELK